MKNPAHQVVTLETALALFKENSGGYKIEKATLKEVQEECEKIGVPFTGELVVNLSLVKANYPRFQWSRLPKLIPVVKECQYLRAMSVADLKTFLVSKGVKKEKRWKLFKEFAIPKEGVVTTDICRKIFFRAMLFENNKQFVPR